MTFDERHNDEEVSWDRSPALSKLKFPRLPFKIYNDSISKAIMLKHDLFEGWKRK